MADLGDFEGDRDFEETTPSTTAQALGTLTVREGLRLHESGDGHSLTAYITPENRDEVRLRSYVTVPVQTASAQPSERLFCRVETVRYAHEFATDDATAIHARRAMRQASIDESDYKFLADLHPIATVIGDPDDPDELTRRMPDRVPKPNTVVRAAADDGVIKTGLKLPQEGVFLGHLAVGGELVTTAASPPTVDYRLRDMGVEDPLIFRHMLVAGGTGSGKTHAAKNILRQFVADDRRYQVSPDRAIRPSIVIIDPQDEYAQLHDDNPDLGEKRKRRFDRERIAHGGVDTTTAFVPAVAGTEYQPTHHRAEQVRFTIPFELVRRHRWLIAGGELNDRQFNALDDLLSAYFDGTRDDPTYADFMDFLETDDTVQQMVKGGKIHESTFDAVHRLVSRSRFRRTFDQSARPITELVDQLVVPGGIATIPTYHLESSAQRTLVVLAVSALLIGEKLTSRPRFDRIAETPLILAMDEAHNYLSAADTVQARRTIARFTEAAKQGRKERLGLFLVTQDPGDIADAIFKQINTRVALNLADEEAVASLNLPPALAAQVSNLELGQMAVYSPDNAEPVQLVGLDHCVVKHAPR